MRQVKKSNFKFGYIVYLSVLIALAIASIVYVKVILTRFEISQPERIVTEQMAELGEMVKNGTIESYFPFPNVTVGKFEEGKNIKDKYYEMLSSDHLDCVLDSKEIDGTRAVYKVKSGEVELASIALRSNGIPIQKLIIFVYYDWQVESITPVVKKQGFDIEIPADFTVSLNGIELGEDELVVPEEGEKVDESLKRYRVDGLYLQPEFKIVTKDGEPTDYNIVKGKVTPVLFDYTLTIPSTLSVTVNGEINPGTDVGNGMIRHAIRELKEPVVMIADAFGNETQYSGGNDLPLTYKRITVPEGYGITVDGVDAPASCAVNAENEELDEVRRFADIPVTMEYRIACLKSGAKIAVSDGSGAAVDLTPYENGDTADLTGTLLGSDEIPAEITNEINVLEVGEMWSKFLSKDLGGGSNGFWQLSEYLIEGSKLYDYAYSWATGIDITFTSIHTLDNPPFTDEKVGNFVKLADNCFRCDIGFVKHMTLSDGNRIADKTNLRFYFVKQTDTWNPTWKVAYQKEVVD